MMESTGHLDTRRGRRGTEEERDSREAAGGEALGENVAEKSQWTKKKIKEGTSEGA